MFVSTRRKKEKNLRIFRDAAFNYDNFVKRYYIEDDNAYITAKVTSYNDIVTSYSIKNYEWVNSDFISYIEEAANYIPVENRIVVDICGCKFTEEQQIVIRRVIKDYFGLQMVEKEHDLKENDSTGLWLLFGAAVTLVIIIIMNSLNFTDSTIISDILSLCIWFFLWEASDYLLIERKNLKQELLYSGQMATIGIEFEEEKELVQEVSDVDEFEGVMEEIEEAVPDYDEIEKENI